MVIYLDKLWRFYTLAVLILEERQADTDRWWCKSKSIHTNEAFIISLDVSTYHPVFSFPSITRWHQTLLTNAFPGWFIDCNMLAVGPQSFDLLCCLVEKMVSRLAGLSWLGFSFLIIISEKKCESTYLVCWNCVLEKYVSYYEQQVKKFSCQQKLSCSIWGVSVGSGITRYQWFHHTATGPGRVFTEDGNC